MKSSSPDQPKKKSESHQIGIGIKAGLNFANVTSAASLNNSSRTGFMAGAFFTSSYNRLFGNRTELLFSRQGYDYKRNKNTGAVNLDYILITHLRTINITKYVQLQFGGQMAYLISAKADSAQSSQLPGPYGKVLDYYNKLDYGVSGGIEVHPFRGLLVGARYNVSFGDLYKMPSSDASAQQPSFIPSVNVKNNLVQIFVGYTF